VNERLSFPVTSSPLLLLSPLMVTAGAVVDILVDYRGTRAYFSLPFPPPPSFAGLEVSIRPESPPPFLFFFLRATRRKQLSGGESDAGIRETPRLPLPLSFFFFFFPVAPGHNRKIVPPIRPAQNRSRSRFSPFPFPPRRRRRRRMAATGGKAFSFGSFFFFFLSTIEEATEPLLF